jgi:hypothetical protein
LLAVHLFFARIVLVDKVEDAGDRLLGLEEGFSLQSYDFPSSRMRLVLLFRPVSSASVLVLVASRDDRAALCMDS